MLLQLALFHGAVEAATPQVVPAEIAVGTTCASVTQIPLHECDALKLFYYSLDGPNWSYQQGWLETNSPCNWIGVTCQGGHVTELSLAFNNLTGSLPAAVGDFSHLRLLNLIHNYVRELPPEIERLTRLESLFLSENKLASLPPEIGNLTSLGQLHLSDNPLTTLPPEMGALSQLNELYLNIPSLWELPPELAHLINLRVVRISSPLLSETLPDMSQWTQLETLSLSGCNLNVWPQVVEQLSSLRSLDLSHNNLVVLPASLGELSTLGQLDLSHNELAAVPIEITWLHLLTELDLSQNQLTTLPDEMGDLVLLQRLNLAANQLAALPASTARLTNIQHELDVAYNRLSTLPPGVEELELVRSDWQATQTVPPVELHTEVLSENQVRLTWAPIFYTADNGYYEILHSIEVSTSVSITTGDSFRYEMAGKSVSKDNHAYLLDGLDTAQVHRFAIRTYTPAHESQPNYLWSELSLPLLHYFSDLTLQIREARPGTVVSATASGFPANTRVAIYANELGLDSLTTDANGTLPFLLDTADADVGDYSLKVVVETEGISAWATTSFVLFADAAPHSPPAEEYPIIVVPAGLTERQNTPRQIYLPTIVR